MTSNEFELKKFEFDQKLQLEELELRKKELDLKIQEQKRQKIFTPLLISIVGGLVTIMTGLILRFYDNRSMLALEEVKTQSALLLKIAEAKTSDEFVNMLDVFKSNGFIKLDSSKLSSFKTKRLSSDFKQRRDKLYHETISVISFLTVNTDYPSAAYTEKLQRFWELYWVELSSVESKDVEKAMIIFGEVLKKVNNGNVKDIGIREELRSAGYDVAQQMKAETASR